MTRQADTHRPEAEVGYTDNHTYLTDELRKLNLMLRLRTAAFRREQAGRSLYVSHEEVDRILIETAPVDPNSADTRDLRRQLSDLQADIDAKVSESMKRGVFLGLPQLAHLFNLSFFEREAVLICLAPELRRSYDLLYAYLQDDITRKRPSVDLVLDLLCETESEKWNARLLLSSQASLLHNGILQIEDDPHNPSGSSGLAQFLKLDPRILHFILGHYTIDARLDGLVKVFYTPASPSEPAVDPDIKKSLLNFIRSNFTTDDAPRRRTVVHLHGPPGVGKRELAVALCHQLQSPLLSLKAWRLPSQGAEAETLLRLAFRESLLLKAPLHISGADVFTREAETAPALRSMLAQSVATYGWLVFLAGEKPWPYPELFEQVLYCSVALPMPGEPVQRTAWQQALQTYLPELPSETLAASLSGRFRLTPGRIQEAARGLAHQRIVQGDTTAVTFERLAAACRAQAHHSLGTLASKIIPHYTWSDLILPDDKRTQLQEMCNQVRYHVQVYQQWGFGRKLAHGKGLSALFTGQPGTGKTMAAEVIASDLQLDLYKIDLARVVSKYIGETEKNLGRIFDEAENSNAILFFDEADALFGKRTEISDSHDRYANIETSYLLQKMEEYEGVVILASNLRENMDNAFLRRIRFIVEFPFPDAVHRLEIWKTHFPPEAPVSEDVDYELLADRIHVAGGNIKNIVLSSAFFAAADGGVINMEHLARGTRREFEKIGKLWDEKVLVHKRK